MPGWVTQMAVETGTVPETQKKGQPWNGQPFEWLVDVFY